MCVCGGPRGFILPDEEASLSIYIVDSAAATAAALSPKRDKRGSSKYSPRSSNQAARCYCCCCSSFCTRKRMAMLSCPSSWERSLAL